MYQIIGARGTNSNKRLTPTRLRVVLVLLSSIFAKPKSATLTRPSAPNKTGRWAQNQHIRLFQPTISPIDRRSETTGTGSACEVSQLVCIRITYRSLALGLDGSRSIHRHKHDDSNVAQVRLDKRPSERERLGKFACDTLHVQRARRG